MSQDDAPGPVPTAPLRGAWALYAASALSLVGVFLSLALTAWQALDENPHHSLDLVQDIYECLALAGCIMVAQLPLVYFGLVRPCRRAAASVDSLTEALDRNSHRDLLTGTLNRTAFDQIIVRELDALRRYGVPFCGLMVDVDGFRALNERLGFQAGDHALSSLAGLLAAHVRRADFVFRWRSGRFLILASGIDAGQAARFAHKLCELVSGHDFGPAGRLTACIGLAQAKAEDSPEAFTTRLKAALLAAKAKGPGGMEQADALA